MNVALARQNAAPGTPLSQLGGLPPIKGQPAGPVAPAKTPSLPAAPPRDMPLIQMVHPSARDRWLTGQISMYTPTMIENTIRGAMSGNLIAVWQMFDLMERTWPRLSKNLNELKTAVLSLGWNLQPFCLKGDKPTPEAQRRKRILEQMIWTMRPDLERDENDFEDTLWNAMDALGKGIALMEVSYEQRPVNVSIDPKVVKMAPMWCPRATQWLHPRYYGYPSSLTPGFDRLMLNIREIKQNNPSVDLPAVADGCWAEIPRDQFIVSIMKQKSGHPLGGSLLAILGYWWAAQNFTWDWFLNFAQIFGMPIRWATYAPGIPQQSIDNILAMLEQMGNAAYAAFPAGTNLELKTGATDARNVPHKVLIDAADTIADIVILGQTSSTQIREGGGVGSGHAASLQGDVRQEKIMGVGKRTAKIMNVQLLPALCRLNFGDDSECPQLVPADAKGKDLLTVAERYQIILQTPGVTVSRAQYYTDNDLVQPDDDDEVLVAMAASSPGNNNETGEEDETAGITGQKAQGRMARAHAADAKLIDNALADATGIAPRWLGAIRPTFSELVRKAQDGTVSDGDFIRAIAKAQKELPDVFGKMDHDSLARIIEQTLAAGVVNGAVRGAMRRQGTRQEVAA